MNIIILDITTICNVGNNHDDVNNLSHHCLYNEDDAYGNASDNTDNDDGDEGNIMMTLVYYWGLQKEW